MADSYDHVLAEGEEIVLPNGWVLSVQGRDGDGFRVNLADADAPAFPGPVVATGVETSSISLSWPAAQDAGPVRYEVVAGTRPAVATGATSTVLTGLAPDTVYEIRVAAVDAGGNRAAAGPVSVRTLSARDKWAVHEPSSGRWSFRLGDGVSRTIYYGVPGDLALFCDWDGDGEDTVGLYRPHEGFVYLRNSNTLGFADLDFYYGIPTDIPLCGDWDGDGVDTVGVYRPGQQRFFLRNSNTLGFADLEFELGIAGDVPLAGDWDGDGIDSVAVYRPATAKVYEIGGGVWDLPSAGQPVVGDLVGSGRDGLAVFADGVIGFAADDGSQQLIRFGGPGSVAVAGWWN